MDTASDRDDGGTSSGPLILHLGHEELIIRQRYETISIVNDLFSVTDQCRYMAVRGGQHRNADPAGHPLYAEGAFAPLPSGSPWNWRRRPRLLA